MLDVVIEECVKVFATLLIMLIGVLGTWLSTKIAKKVEFQNIAKAVEVLTDMAQQTVGELEQTMVKDMKEAALDHKLTDEEITQLGMMLYNITIRKMSEPMMQTLRAASVDIQAVITSAGEAWINDLRRMDEYAGGDAA